MCLKSFCPFALLSFIFFSSLVRADDFKPRVVVLTDVSTWETDDSESLVRLMVHNDLLEIEALVFTTGWSLDKTRDEFMQLIHNAIDAYEKDLPNLSKRSNQSSHAQNESRQTIGQWPSPNYLRERTVFGSKRRGAEHIGEGNDSAGSKLIIDLADEDDDRPLWITVWGGGNTLAQAIWRVKQDRSEVELKRFLQKLRVYTITDQDRDQKTPFSDSSHQWMRREFEKELFFIWDECAWKFQNGTGKKPLGRIRTVHPRTWQPGQCLSQVQVWRRRRHPSLLAFVAHWIERSKRSDARRLGGYFCVGPSQDKVTSCYTNFSKPDYDLCRNLEEHFYQATFNNFAARMAWAKDGRGNRNPVVKLNGDASLAILSRTVKAGEKVILDASESNDPDGDKLSFKWWVLNAAGSYQQPINIQGADQARVTVQVPDDSGGLSFHLICEVIDDGAPSLTSYRRIVFQVD